MQPDIQISTEQYQRLRREEVHGSLILQFELIEDVIEMSDFCYMEDGQWFITQGAYEYAQRQGFNWEQQK